MKCVAAAAGLGDSALTSRASRGAGCAVGSIGADDEIAWGGGQSILFCVARNLDLALNQRRCVCRHYVEGVRWWWLAGRPVAIRGNDIMTGPLSNSNRRFMKLAAASRQMAVKAMALAALRRIEYLRRLYKVLLYRHGALTVFGVIVEIRLHGNRR